MLHLRVLTAANACHADLGVADLPGFLQDNGALIWVDADEPTPEELAQLGTLFGWESLLVEDLIHQGQRPKLDAYGDYSYLVMHAIRYQAGSPDGNPCLSTFEVDFVIGAGYVVTSHPEPIPDFGKRREAAEHTLRNGRDHLLWVLTDDLVDSYGTVFDAMDDAVDALEDEIIANPSQTLLGRIFEMKRDAVLARRVIGPQLDIFARLTAPGYGIIAESHAWYFRDVHDHLLRGADRVDSYRELMAGALDAYLSTTSNRMNEVMKRLTVMAALFLPVTFITGLLGMNLRVQPLWQDGFFWVLLIAMLGFCVVQFALMRRRGWA